MDAAGHAAGSGAGRLDHHHFGVADVEARACRGEISRIGQVDPKDKIASDRVFLRSRAGGQDDERAGFDRSPERMVGEDVFAAEIRCHVAVEVLDGHSAHIDRRPGRSIVRVADDEKLDAVDRGVLVFVHRDTERNGALFGRTHDAQVVGRVACSLRVRGRDGERITAGGGDGSADHARRGVDAQSGGQSARPVTRDG